MKQNLLFVALLCPFLLNTQTKASIPRQQLTEENPAADSSRFHLGFHLGYTSTYFFDQQQPSNPVSRPGSGIKLGLHSYYGMTEYLAISPKVELTMNSGHLKYSDGEGIARTSPAMSSSLQFMGHLMVKLPIGKYQPFLNIGPNFRLPVKQENLTEGNYGFQSDVALDVGIGFERAFKPFRILPEIRYSYGFKNVNLNPYMGNLYLHQLSLIIAFTD